MAINYDLQKILYWHSSRGGGGIVNEIEIDFTAGINTITQVGSTSYPIHEAMKRCIVKDDGTVNYYLDASDSHNKDGVSPSITGTAESASAIHKLKDTGAFATGVVADQYVKNITKNKYFRITAVDSEDEVSLLYNLESTDDKWGTADVTTASHLIDSTVDFVALGVTAGMIAFNRTDNTFAIITNVTTTDLTLDADIFVSGEKWSVITDCFETGDEFEVCTAIFNNSEGQVMVEIPKFYYYYNYNSPKINIAISQTAKSGYVLHPAFNPAGVEKDYIYVGAFESTRTDNGENEIYQGINTFLANNPDVYVIGSQAGRQPITNGRRRVVRDTVSARGNNWHMLDAYTHHAIQILYLTEYADPDCQSAIGAGYTDWDAFNVNSIAYNARYGSIHTGWSLKDGNGTANRSKGDGLIGSYVSYRGLENLWGHLNTSLDGINIMSDSKVYLCNTPTSYFDATTTGDYSEVATLIEGSGLYADLANVEHLFTPLNLSSAAILEDGYKHTTGSEKVAITSGSSGYQDNGGLFTFSATTLVANRGEHNGYRVVCR
jgi:hypothetical protein